MDKIYCKCCQLEVPANEWDFLYGTCSECAFCGSLGHAPCCHGGCVKHIQPPALPLGPELTRREALLAMWERLVIGARGVIACV